MNQVGLRTMDETELLFEIAWFLDGFWTTGIGLSGTEVRGKLSVLKDHRPMGIVIRSP